MNFGKYCCAFIFPLLCWLVNRFHTLALWGNTSRMFLSPACSHLCFSTESHRWALWIISSAAVLALLGSGFPQGKCSWKEMLFSTGGIVSFRLQLELAVLVSVKCCFASVMRFCICLSSSLNFPVEAFIDISLSQSPGINWRKTGIVFN